VVTLIGFVAGTVIATFHMPFWWGLPSLGVISLGEYLGWVPALGVQLALFGAIAWGAWQIEQRYAPPRPCVTASPTSWLPLLRGPWPLLVGAVGLAVLNALTLLVAGHPWTITWAFSLWGAKFLQVIGYDLSHVPFWTGAFQQHALAASVFADKVSVMDFGIILGALLAAGLAGRFTPTLRVPLRTVAVALCGGLILGYGARLAFGCNIGAYFSGIASTSLHGWLWLVGALLGTPLGVRLRAYLRHE
jgi:hypothetical protein